ncbi:MAG: 4'-phosphopantetheinyl transferase superfamily protein [Myxococcota bacterium]
MPADESLIEALADQSRALLGANVRTRAAALAGPIPSLPPEEDAVVATAVEKRRREFAVGRTLARALLAEVGSPVRHLPRREDRAPEWPSGVAGTITHTDEVAVVAVTRGEVGLGLDVEEASPLPEAMARLIVRPDERTVTRDLAKVAFSAKEAFYKAQYRYTETLLDFLDVSLHMDLSAQTFEVEVHHPAGRYLPTPRAQGSWRRIGPWILSAVRI